MQLKVFYENRDDDSDEFAQRFDNVRLELDDINECFELVKNMVMDTPAEPYFLSIFQVRFAELYLLIIAFFIYENRC